MNDKVDDFFEREREAVPLLAAPPGRLAELQTGARRRRNRNTTMVSVAAAVVLAVAGTGAVVGAQNVGGNGSATSSSPDATPTAGGRTTATAAAVDTAVPAGFTAWSVSFVNKGMHGWALGGYPCSGGQQCVAVLETTDSMRTWQTVAKPAFAAEYGMTSSNAILRFSGSRNGWMVGSEGVYATHDAGRSWRPVGQLQFRAIDALEAWGNRTYAIGRGGSDVWVTDDQSSDAWYVLSSAGLPAAPNGVDLLTAANKSVSVARTVGATTTVRESGDNGQHWHTVASPCPKNLTQPPVFALVDENIGRFVCGNGKVYGLRVGHKPVVEAQFHLTSTTGQPVQARAVATNHIGTVVAYSGAGLWGFVVNGTASHPQAGDFSYVGLTNDSQGIALAPQALDTYWVTTTGGLSWNPKSFG